MKMSKIIEREKEAAAMELLKAGQVFADLAKIMLQGVPVYESEATEFSGSNRKEFESLYITYGSNVLDYICISGYISELLKHIPPSKHVYQIHSKFYDEQAWVVGSKNAAKVRQDIICGFCSQTPCCEQEYRKKRELEKNIQRTEEGKINYYELSDLKNSLAEINQYIREAVKDRLDYYRETVVIDKLT